MSRELEELRARMEAKIQLWGLSDQRTIKASQDLDTVIVLIQKQKSDSNLYKLNKLDLSKYGIADEAIKLSEEHHEFQVAAVKDDRENMLEEFFDVIQAAVGVMQKANITDEEIREGLVRHNKKLLRRGWKFDGCCRWC